MKILIIEAYSAANIGSGALVENSVNLLKKNFPNASIEILAQSPDSIHKLTGLPCYHELITLPLGQSRIKQLLWLMTTAFWMLIHFFAVLCKRAGIHIPVAFYTFNYKTRIAIEKVLESDIVVSVGAERINDNFYKAILFSLYMLWTVKMYKKFLVLFPQTIGPFHFRVTRFLSARILNHCDIIFLRDKKSRGILDEIGVTVPLVIDTCDVAVLQPAIDAEKSWVLLKKYNIQIHNKPLVGMSVMQWSYVKAKGKSRYREYTRAIAAVADDFIENKGVHILFIATNVLTEGCREDDVAAARDIHALMKNKADSTILDSVYTPAQMKGIMSLLELCLVTRMHACIFSTGIFTPTASINYQFKLKEYMKLMGLGNYTVDIDNVTIDNLQELMDRAWQDREKNREVLRNHITSWSENLENKMQEMATIYYRS